MQQMQDDKMADFSDRRAAEYEIGTHGKRLISLVPEISPCALI